MGSGQSRVTRRSGLEGVPLGHVGARPGQHVLPVLDFCRAALPRQVDLRRRSHQDRAESHFQLKAANIGLILSLSLRPGELDQQLTHNTYTHTHTAS